MGKYINPKPLKEGRGGRLASERRYAAANKEARRTASRETQRRKRLDPVFREKCRKASAEHRAKHPREFLSSLLKSQYGITLEEYEALEHKQGGLCAICGQPETRRSMNGKIRSRLSIDHCHTTKTVRGLLCSECNKGLGKFRERAELLAKAIAYLARPTPDIPPVGVAPERNLLERRQNSGLRKFGITLEQYRVIERSQDGRCAICEEQETTVSNGRIKRLAVDHCHVSMLIRGLLCQACNQGLGTFLDSSAILVRAMVYLTS